MELSGWVAPDQGDETEPNEKGIGQANGQRRAVAEPPGTARTAGGLGRQVLANAQATQRRKAPATTLPLTPDGGTKPTPYPLVEAAQHRGRLTEPEVAPPSNEVARQLRNKTRETDALRAARQLPNPRLEPCQRLRRKAQLGPPTNREAETQKASPRRTSHRALGPRSPSVSDAGQGSLSRLPSPAHPPASTARRCCSRRRSARSDGRDSPTPCPQRPASGSTTTATAGRPAASLRLADSPDRPPERPRSRSRESP